MLALSSSPQPPPHCDLCPLLLSLPLSSRASSPSVAFSSHHHPAASSPTLPTAYGHSLSCHCWWCPMVPIQHNYIYRKRLQVQMASTAKNSKQKRRRERTAGGFLGSGQHIKKKRRFLVSPESESNSFPSTTAVIPGLRNTGNECYAISVLQALASTDLISWLPSQPIVILDEQNDGNRSSSASQQLLLASLYEDHRNAVQTLRHTRTTTATHMMMPFVAPLASRGYIRKHHSLLENVNSKGTTQPLHTLRSLKVMR